MTAILVLGHTTAPFTKRIVEAMADYYPDCEIWLYLYGRETTTIADYPSHPAVDTIIWDHEFGIKQPRPPDTEYLAAFEQRHGSLRRCIGADRKLSKDGLATVFNDNHSQYTDDEIRGAVEVRARRLEALFEQESFEFVYGPYMMYLGGMLTAMLARSRDVPFFRAASTRIENQFTLLTDVYEYSAPFWEAFEAVKAEIDSHPRRSEAEAYVQRVRNGESAYSVQTPDASEYETSLESRLRYITKLLWDERGGLRTTYYAETRKATYIKQKLLKRVRKAWLERSNLVSPFDPDEQYVYFPLQVQPEISLMIWAPDYQELDTVSRTLARSVPIDHGLYVNEHPYNWGVRSRSFYRGLYSEPNLKLLSRRLDTHRVIDNASAVVCVTATVGIEALIKGVPVVTFGRPGQAPMYANLETTHVASFGDGLSETISEAISSRVDHDEVLAYIVTALDHGIPRDDPAFPTKICERIEAAIDSGIVPA